MGNEKPEKKKLSVKTRLILIAAMFAVVNVAFFATESFKDTDESIELSDESIELSDDQIIDEEQIVELEEELDERLYYKFNAPSP